MTGHLFIATDIKCKWCGGFVNSLNGLLICEYCGWYDKTHPTTSLVTNKLKRITMKILRFNKENIPQRELGAATVYVHSGGNFCLNEPTAVRLGISADKDYFIEVIQDEENPRDWYFMLTDEKLGFKLRKEKDKNKYNFNAGQIAKSILKVLPKTESATTPTTATLLIAADLIEVDGLSLWPILTSSFKPRK